MATTEERLKILQMIQEGKITPEDGVKLLEILQDGKKDARTTPGKNQVLGGAGKEGRFLRVRVTDTDSGKTRVNVRLPVNVLMVGMKMGAKFAPEIEGLDVGSLMEIIRSGEMGRVVDVFDEEDGEHVEVFIE